MIGTFLLSLMMEMDVKNQYFMSTEINILIAIQNYFAPPFLKDCALSTIL